MSFSAAVMIQLDSGQVCILGVKAYNQKCWGFLVAGAEQCLGAGMFNCGLYLKELVRRRVIVHWAHLNSRRKVKLLQPVI